jgi:glycosyltransferase involved in cell wall biosynthesis
MSIRISIITAVYNRATSIRAAIDSVLQQRDVDIEYIVVDGNSDDGTEGIVRSYGPRISKYVREPDTGIYNALNKGIQAATGDIVGFVHADDALHDMNVIKKVSDAFRDPSIDAVYGDLIYVHHYRPERIVRYWQAEAFDSRRFRRGWMPPHPTFYLRRRHYLEQGGYREDFSIAADYELILRMLYKNRLKPKYIDDIMIRMQIGGISNKSLWNRLLSNNEDKRAWKVNGLVPPIGLRLMKPLQKLQQYWKRPV